MLDRFEVKPNIGSWQVTDNLRWKRPDYVVRTFAHEAEARTFAEDLNTEDRIDKHIRIDGKDWWYGYYEEPYQPRYTGPEICCFRTAEAWERWCGETQWSRLMRRCGELGASCGYWCGVPRSASAIPLSFAVYHFGKSWGSRLKDLRAAVAYLENYHNREN